MHAQTLIPADRINFVTIGADKEGHTINKSFLFDGQGQQVLNGDADPRAPKLPLPASAFTVAGQRGQEPGLDAAAFMEAIRKGDNRTADALVAAYKAAYSAYTGQGGAPLADVIIDACLKFVQDNVPDLHVGATGAEWNIVRESTVARIPTRATADTPIMVVVQPTPSWGR